MKRWPQHKAAFWETAPFFRLLLPFAAGIFCYYSTALIAAPLSYFLVIIAVSFLLYIAAVVRSKSPGVVPFLLLHVFLFSGGLALSHLSDDRNSGSWYGKALDSHGTYFARITGPPAEKETTWKLPVSLVAVADNGKAPAITGDAILYVYKDEQPVTLNQGDSILVPGNWLPIKNAGNPFEFDYAAHCRRNNIYHQQFCSLDDIRLYAKGNPAADPLTVRTHNWCMSQLARYIADTKTQGLLQAMLLGDEVNLDPELRQSFSQTGIIHIIAISGGNVAIFFIVISALLWWMKDKRHLWLKYAIALPLVWFYVIMAGSSPSAVRAAVMFSILALGIMMQKNNNSLNQLFATAFVLLCAQPAWLYSLGFQLSFVAVLSLVLFYMPVYKWFSPANIVVRKLWGVVAASIAAELLVAPVVVYYFHNFPLLFLVANVAAYVFMGVVLILGIAIISLSWIPAVAGFLGAATTVLVTFFDKIVLWLQQFNPPSFSFIAISLAELVLIYLSIAGLSVFLLRKQKPAMFVASAASMLLVLSFCYHQWQWRHQSRLVVFNTSWTSRVELFTGKRYRVLSKDTVNSKITYATTPAHINWQAYTPDTVSNISQSYTIHGKTILMPDNTTPPQHADYLLLSGLEQQTAAELKQLYTPSLVVLSNTMSRKQQEQFCKECMQAGLKVHVVAKDGAFVLE
jgi:competence protein ComEC